MGIRDYINKRKAQHKINTSNQTAEARLEKIETERMNLELRKKVQDEEARNRELKRSLHKGKFNRLREATAQFKEISHTLSPKSTENIKRKSKGKKGKKTKTLDQKPSVIGNGFGQGINPAFGFGKK